MMGASAPVIHLQEASPDAPPPAKITDELADSKGKKTPGMSWHICVINNLPCLILAAR